MQASALFQFWDFLFGVSVLASELTWWQMAVRAAIVYVILIAFVRFGKKRFLGETTAFDAILMIVIGSLATRAIAAASPFVATLTGVLALVALHFLFSALACRWRPFSYLIKGRPTVIIANGRIDREAMRDAHMTQDDLDEDLRTGGVLKASEVREARLERDGKLSVVKR